MPISATYQWKDSYDSLAIEVPLKGVAPSKVDILGKYAIFEDMN